MYLPFSNTKDSLPKAPANIYLAGSNFATIDYVNFLF